MKRIALVGLILGAVVFGLVHWDAEPARDTAYELELARINGELDALRTLVEKRPDAWTLWDRVAGTYLDKAALTGSFEDYAAAENALDRAFTAAQANLSRNAEQGDTALAGASGVQSGGGSVMTAVSTAPQAGPFLSRARFSFSVHRFDAVEADLRSAEMRIIQDDVFRSSVRSLRAELALQEGRAELARRELEAALQLHRSPQGLARLAHAHWKLGEYDRAEELYREAETGFHGESNRPRAWVHLQLGIMDLERDRLNEAMVHYRDADKLFGGWWLIEEHMAEILALQGQTDRAEAQYKSLVERTGNPLFMAALADIYSDRGETDLATTWTHRADQAQAVRAALYPEAAAGHH